MQQQPALLQHSTVQLSTTFKMTSNYTSSDIDAWLNNAGRFPVLPADKVLHMTRQIQSLEQADPKRIKLVQTLVNHNLKLVVTFVRSFMAGSHKKWGDAETCDYLQVGAIGLQKAAERFDPTRGYSFSTYAQHWIRSTVSRYNMKTITLVSVSESASRQVVFYKRNGYMKGKSDRRALSQGECQGILQQTSLAYSCLSLDKPMESGNTMLGQIPCERPEPDLLQFGEKLDRTVRQIGISAIGKEILVSSIVNGEGLKEIASRLGVSLNKVKTEKRKAITLAKANRSRFVDGIM